MNLNRCSSLNELHENYEFEKSLGLILSLAERKKLMPHLKNSKTEMAFSRIHRNAFILTCSEKRVYYHCLKLNRDICCHPLTT